MPVVWGNPLFIRWPLNKPGFAAIPLRVPACPDHPKVSFCSLSEEYFSATSVHTDVQCILCSMGHHIHLSSAVAPSLSAHQNHLQGLLKDDSLHPIPRFWSGAQEFAFLISSQMMMTTMTMMMTMVMITVQGPHFKKH